MRLNLFHAVRRSIIFYKSAVFYQFIIIALLSGIITGSFLIGKSVRTSLMKNSSQRLGNTGILVSSGVRYFDPALASRLSNETGAKCISIIESDGYCQNFQSGITATDIQIFGITHDFFKFHGIDTIIINRGEVAINSKLARQLELKPGDDITIRFKKISDIPSNAPFAPDQVQEESIVLTVGMVLSPDQTGNFSLGISQIVPLNIFLNLSDIENKVGNNIKVNRLIIEKKKEITASIVYNYLKENLIPEDIGLNIRLIKATNGFEITSDRIFIDQELLDNIVKVIPSARPVITYLANSMKSERNSTPYSFIAALPQSLYSQVPEKNNIIVNKWLADDLNAGIGDTVTLSWYVSGAKNNLEERGSPFRIATIVDIEGIWSDSLLMPSFPGISGRESCSAWDAGIPVRLDEIRKKDEDYWNRFKGTPKGFISYEKGRELWGNNFGPATAIRFPSDLTENELTLKLKGSFEPDKTGFSIRDLNAETISAANEGVDFSTLFLSLGFFIIVASVYLLSHVVSVFFDSRKTQIYTLRALGFTNSKINRLLFYETVSVAFAGTVAGVITGSLFNSIIIHALNSVWIGAVQTDTLKATFDLPSMIMGFAISSMVTLSFLKIKTWHYLKKLNRKETGYYKGYSAKWNLLFFIISFSLAIILISLSFLLAKNSAALSFSGGSLMLVSFILATRQFVLTGNKNGKIILKKRNSLSRSYFAFYPSQITAPVLFIAVGLFVLIITGANRKDFNKDPFSSSGGTGGYLLWCETAIPVIDDLNTPQGIQKNNIDTEELKGMGFLQVKKLAGDDASCLNLNHIKTPPILGLDASHFIKKGSFSFAEVIKEFDGVSPWELINKSSSGNTIYGIADQTVLQWGLKLKPGDTLVIRDENGQPLNIILAAGLKSSVFQGNIIISECNFNKFMPSISGSTILLIDGLKEFAEYYQNLVSERFKQYGISIGSTNERLAEFYQVTNAYLSVFNVLGAFGLVLGVIGLGFILMRNYNMRKREFGLMLASGFSINKIRKSIFYEQLFILFSGVISGSVSAFLATLPSLTTLSDIPWSYLMIMILAVTITGIITLLISVRVVGNASLTYSLRKE